MSSKTDYFENKLIDFLFRNQTLTIGSAVATWSTAPVFYIGLLKVAPTDSTAGTEHTGGSYARQPITASLTAMAGTQSAGSTTASSGTNGTTSNNASIVFSDMPDTSISGTNGSVAFGIYDAVTGGNLLEWALLTSQPILAATGATLTFAAGNLTIQEDN